MNDYYEDFEEFADEDVYFYGNQSFNLEKLEKDIILGSLLEDYSYEQLFI